MAVEKKTRTLHYKQAIVMDQVKSLQEMLVDTITKKDSPYFCATNRRRQLSEDGNTYELINRYKDHGGMILCQLVLFEQGRSQMTVVINDQTSMFEINPIHANDIHKAIKGRNSNSKTEFLESMLYFGVTGNHVVVMGTKALSTKDLERHLSWYLSHLTRETQSSISLSDKPSKSAIDKIEKAPAKSIKIGSRIEYLSEVDKNEENDNSSIISDTEINETKSLLWKPKTIGAEILQCLRDNGHLGGFDYNESFDDANLQLSLQLTFMRTTTKSGQKALDKFASSLRNIDKEEVTINLQGGGKIRGDELTLTHKIRLSFSDGKVDEGDLYFQMVEWLKSKIGSNEVTNGLLDKVIDEEA